MTVEYGLWFGRYPAIVREYIADKRTCRIEIPGITDGHDILPEAEIEYPIGDKSKAGPHTTEIEIVPGDTVWITFIGGDPRYPIITGWRNPRAGNSVDWRRWHHANVEILADALMRMIAGGDILIESATHVTVKAPRVTVDAPETICTGNVTVKRTVTVEDNLHVGTGASGSFTTPTGLTVMVSDGIVTNIF